MRPIAAAPSGRLIRKIQRQDAYWASDPPSGRAEHRRDAPHAGQPALHPAPLVQVVQVAGQRVDGGHDRARAEALQPAEADQADHAPGRGRAQGRPGQEDQGAR